MPAHWFYNTRELHQTFGRIDRYLAPPSHRDTYVEECHRGFFENLKAGRKPDKAAVREKHIGGMVAVVPLYAALRSHGSADADARRAVHSHVEVTHAGAQVGEAVDTLLTVAAELWRVFH